jgi:hypothetical protein
LRPAAGTAIERIRTGDVVATAQIATQREDAGAPQPEAQWSTWTTRLTETAGTPAMHAEGVPAVRPEASDRPNARVS